MVKRVIIHKLGAKSEVSQNVVRRMQQLIQQNFDRYDAGETGLRIDAKARSFTLTFGDTKRHAKFVDFAKKRALANSLPAVPLAQTAVSETPPIKIGQYHFSAQTYNCLKKANILSDAVLMEYTRSELRSIQSFGPLCLIEVMSKLLFNGGRTLAGESIESTPIEALFYPYVLKKGGGERIKAALQEITTRIKPHFGQGLQLIGDLPDYSEDDLRKALDNGEIEWIKETLPQLKLALKP